jgi:hypothetical protein
MERFPQIFEEQRRLLDRFDDIQMSLGTLECDWRHLKPERALRLQDRDFQMMVRRYASQITEELVEAFAATEVHRPEELADALHYYVDLAIILGVTPIELAGAELGDDAWETAFKIAEQDVRWQDFTLTYYQVESITSLHLATNLLKNRPWRSDTRTTPWDLFLEMLVHAFRCYIRLCVCYKITPDMLYHEYFKKNAINHERASAQ